MPKKTPTTNWYSLPEPPRDQQVQAASNDVVIGRGSGNSNIFRKAKGNYRFLAWNFKAEYAEAGKMKSNVADKVIQAVAMQDPPGKFLLAFCDSKIGSDEKKSIKNWRLYLASPERARLSISHTLRDGRSSFPRLQACEVQKLVAILANFMPESAIVVCCERSVVPRTGIRKAPRRQSPTKAEFDTEFHHHLIDLELPCPKPPAKRRIGSQKAPENCMTPDLPAMRAQQLLLTKSSGSQWAEDAAASQELPLHECVGEKQNQSTAGRILCKRAPPNILDGLNLRIWEKTGMSLSGDATCTPAHPSEYASSASETYPRAPASTCHLSMGSPSHAIWSEAMLGDPTTLPPQSTSLLSGFYPESTTSAVDDDKEVASYSLSPIPVTHISRPTGSLTRDEHSVEMTELTASASFTFEDLANFLPSLLPLGHQKCESHLISAESHVKGKKSPVTVATSLDEQVDFDEGYASSLSILEDKDKDAIVFADGLPVVSTDLLESSDSAISVFEELAIEMLIDPTFEVPVYHSSQAVYQRLE